MCKKQQGIFQGPVGTKGYQASEYSVLELLHLWSSIDTMGTHVSFIFSCYIKVITHVSRALNLHFFSQGNS